MNLIKLLFILLYPWWVTGYTDGEGCFSIKFAKRKQIKIGWQVEPSFVIGLLRGIKQFFFFKKNRLKVIAE